MLSRHFHRQTAEMVINKKKTRYKSQSPNKVVATKSLEVDSRTLNHSLMQALLSNKVMVVFPAN